MAVATWPFTTYINSYSNVEEIKKVLTKKEIRSEYTAHIAKSRKSHHICGRAVARERARALAHSQRFLAYIFLVIVCSRENRRDRIELTVWLAG